MGNIFGAGRKMAKVMKVDGETMNLKTPLRVRDVIKDYPGYVMMESSAVKQLGIRAKPLEVYEELKPKKIYFLLELPKIEERNQVPRRVRSGIQMSAKDKLEHLMLSRRCSSDISITKARDFEHGEGGAETGGGTVRLRMRLPKSQVARLVEDSKDASDAAAKIVDLCLVRNSHGGHGGHEGHGGHGGNGVAVAPKGIEEEGMLMLQQQQSQWKPCLGSIKETFKPCEKRVGFLTVDEGELVR